MDLFFNSYVEDATEYCLIETEIKFDNMLPKMFVTLKPELSYIISSILRISPYSVLIKMKDLDNVSRFLIRLNHENARVVLVSIKMINDDDSADRVLNQINDANFLVILNKRIDSSIVFQEFEPKIQINSIGPPTTTIIEGIFNNTVNTVNQGFESTLSICIEI